MPNAYVPEGPEIRRAADDIAKVLVGQRIVEVKFGLARLQTFADALRNQVVTRIDTHGKAMLTRFDCGLTLYSHNQLYGRWYTRKRAKLPATRRSLRVALHTATHSALLYSASDISVLDARQLSEHSFLNKLGPDILDEGLTSRVVRLRLEDSAFRNRSLGALFLDQAFLAGLGNYLRSEILWAARLDPAEKPSELPSPALDRLARQTLIVSRRSYKSGGVTLPATLARDLRKSGLTFAEYRFQVYGRAGQVCRRCDCAVQRRNASGRGLFFCPGCQTRDPAMRKQNRE